jgi:hypothetical protein
LANLYLILRNSNVWVYRTPLSAVLKFSHEIVNHSTLSVYLFYNGKQIHHITGSRICAVSA